MGSSGGDFGRHLHFQVEKDDPHGRPFWPTYTVEGNNGNEIQKAYPASVADASLTEAQRNEVASKVQANTVNPMELVENGSFQRETECIDSVQPPEARISSPPDGGKFIVGETISFNGSNSSDPDGDIAVWTWDFGDGTIQESLTASGATQEHSYSSPGTYTVELTVEDNDGATDTDSVKIEIEEALAANVVDDDQEECPNAGHTNIQDAIDAASSGDEIVVCTGSYGEFSVDNRLAIRSKSGPNVTSFSSASIGADDVEIKGFTVTGGDGIFIGSGSRNTTIENNEFSSVSGIQIFPQTGGHQVLNNTIEGKPIVYLENVSGHTVTGNPRQVIMLNSENIIVEGLTLEANYPLQVIETSDSKFSDNSVSTSRTGVVIRWLSNDNEVVGNDIDAFGAVSGMSIQQSDRNKVWQNRISGTPIQAIGMSNTEDNIVDHNKWRGFTVTFTSTNDVIFLNDFDVNNVSLSFTNNTWHNPAIATYTYENDTYTNHLGNHWDNYSGSDVDGDGIGDIPFEIMNGTQDAYPLIDSFESYTIVGPQ